jgi:hypothetical protein
MRSKAIAAHQTIKEKELFILTMWSKAIAAQKQSRFARAKQL